MSPFIQAGDDPEENRARRSGEFSLDVDGETMFRMLKRSGGDELCTDASATAARAPSEQKAEELREQVSRIAEAARRTPPAKQLPLSRLDDGLPERDDRLRLDLKLPKSRVDRSDQRVDVSLRSGDGLVASRSFKLADAISDRSLDGDDGVLPSLLHLLKSIEDFLGVHIETSLMGYGVDPTTPMAPAEGATSAGGDIVREGTDTAPGSRTPVEESDATGATTCEGSPRWSRPTDPTNGSEVDDDQ
ncbi:hypothetical protein [Brevibacterium casei]|uniref:Uncharacterized protein n=1 Tax=Brevibacterium casei TaxID=33889 RepID=A0A7T2TGN6_9MICO|nr:hypothetical protein [Brevibacterium casei]QPS33424.1 hypothetical protein I6G59_16060 [Brevibacterium casei]